MASGETERVRQWRDRGGVHCSSCCKGWSLSLIGCFAIRKLRDEDKLALYNDHGQDGLGMLYKESQEVFLKTEVCIWAKAQIANSHHPFGCSSLPANSIPAFTAECQPGSVMHNELAACVAVTNRRLKDGHCEYSFCRLEWEVDVHQCERGNPWMKLLQPESNTMSNRGLCFSIM